MYLIFLLPEPEITYYTRDCDNATEAIEDVNVNLGLGTAKGTPHYCMANLCNSATMRQIPVFVPIMIALFSLILPTVLS